MANKAGAEGGPIPRCPTCGRAAAADGCRLCHGTLRHLDGRGAVAPGRGPMPLDLLSGFLDVVRAVFTLVHGRQYVGLLARPVAAHTLAFGAMLLVYWLLLHPAFAAGFTGDDARGAALWAVTCALVLMPPLLELLAGPAQTTLLATTERAQLGLAEASAPAGALRLGDRAIAVVAAVAALPLAMALVMVPWIGLPAIVLVGAATAAVVWLRAPLARAGYDRRARLELIWRNRWRALGAGFGLLVALVVPFVNLLLLSSVAAVAGTSAFLRFEKRPPA